jgi:hypothetical protein
MEYAALILASLLGLCFLGYSKPASKNEEKPREYKSPFIKQLEESNRKTNQRIAQLSLSSQALKKQNEKLGIKAEILRIRKGRLYKYTQVAQATLEKKVADTPPPPAPKQDEDTP